MYDVKLQKPEEERVYVLVCIVFVSLRNVTANELQFKKLEMTTDMVNF